MGRGGAQGCTRAQSHREGPREELLRRDREDSFLSPAGRPHWVACGTVPRDACGHLPLGWEATCPRLTGPSLEGAGRTRCVGTAPPSAFSPTSGSLSSCHHLEDRGSPLSSQNSPRVPVLGKRQRRFTHGSCRQEAGQGDSVVRPGSRTASGSAAGGAGPVEVWSGRREGGCSGPPWAGGPHPSLQKQGLGQRRARAGRAVQWRRLGGSCGQGQAVGPWLQQLLCGGQSPSERSSPRATVQGRAELPGLAGQPGHTRPQGSRGGTEPHLTGEAARLCRG